jgi:hypothetical protein
VWRSLRPVEGTFERRRRSGWRQRTAKPLFFVCARAADAAADGATLDRALAGGVDAPGGG